ncbi:hypothetical protein [Geodermatophilus sp. SYSU D01119]
MAETALLPWILQLGTFQVIVSVLQIGICAAGIARSAHPAPRPIALVTFVFLFSWLGVAPIYQLSHGTAAWGDSAVLDSPLVPDAMLINLLATTVLFVGLLLGPGSRHPAEPAPTVRRSPVPGRPLCLAYLGCCIVLAPGAIASAGGVAGLFSSRADRAASLEAAGISGALAGGVQVALVSILPGALATAVAYLALLRVIHQVKTRSWAQVDAVDALVLALGLTLVVLFANPFVNTRALSAAALGSLVLVLTRPRSRRSGLVLAAALLTATLVAYPAANAFRGEDVTYATGFDAFAGQDFDGFQQSVNAVAFVRDVGHSWGNYTVSGVLYVVPRSVWEDKATPASIDVAAHRGYAFTNLSLPFHTELYVDFGVLGMCVILFGIAAAARRCDLAWTRAPDSGLALLVPYASLAVLSIIRGPIGSNAPVYLTNLVLIGLGLWWARERRRDTTGPVPSTSGRVARYPVGRTAPIR